MSQLMHPKLHKADHQDGGDDEITVLALSGLLADQQTPLSHSTDKHGSAVLDTVAKLTAQQFCRIKTGTYTGDGSTSQAITGIGFQPKFILIHDYQTANATATEQHLKLANDPTDYDHRITSGAVYGYINMIESLDADGFTVNDYDSDLHPNKNGQVYCYICLG